ncbi:hypothetical protein [Kitasatospora sp. NPDC096140]|uniref:hypothetical protein n=1 Tax=Kitasatospora sp. NPDC096140 TaxID=3155425 RepID=UPI00332DC868
MTKQLTVHNATIQTAAVEVKTLTISGKQVTLAVFRQLQEEAVLDPTDATIAGEAWGRVNYHPDKCGDDKEHIHVVWQRDGELRRAAVRAPAYADYPHPTAGLYAEALIADGLRRHSSTEPREDGLRVLKASTPGGLGIAWSTHLGVRFRGTLRKEFLDTYSRGYSHWSSAHGGTNTEEGLWSLVRDAAGAGATTESLADQLPSHAYNQSWETLKALPQLFVAV